ncbi:MAG TPA: lytic transglycosylase domain-containing protein [Vicinamibacterales bacterium]|nr:lytic transglycosylase domain-containing protein [Vicinamibacterales bacterium]
MTFVSFVSFVLMVFSAAPARAELVFFASGRSMSVKSHRIDGDSLVLTLRSGGEVICDRSAITRIAPDEVPYPEPEPVATVQVAALDHPDQRYSEIIDKASAAQGVDPQLVRAMIQVESAYQQRARSRKGAMGLMQLMPETAREYGVTDPYDPQSNIEAGIKHLKALLQRFPKDLALAAYNAGETAVERFRGIPPYPETRAYVASILALAGR